MRFRLPSYKAFHYSVLWTVPELVPVRRIPWLQDHAQEMLREWISNKREAQRCEKLKICGI